MMGGIFVGVGSNLGDASSQVKSAISQIGQIPEVKVLRSASLYGSKPFGPVEQNDFVNTVIEIESSLEPHDLLKRLKQLEQNMGRVHGVRWGPREIDLDILIYGSRKFSSATLQLPHPGITERAFVLIPLAELEPELVLPGDLPILDAIQRLEPGLVWLLDEAETSSL